MTGEDAGLPVAYITLGSAGSGKSTLSKQISALTGAAYLDKDALAEALVRVALQALGQDPSDRESNAVYVERVMPAEYSTLLEVAGRNLELGHSVVIDAPFVAYLSDPDYLATAVRAAHWPAARVRVIHVRASREIVRERLLARGNARDRVKLDAWDAYWERFGTLECRWTLGEHSFFLNDSFDSFEALAELLDLPGDPTPTPRMKNSFEA